MRRYYAMEEGMYVNYISLFTGDPIRLDDTPIDYKLLTFKRAKQLVYTEREAKVLQKINRNVILVEIGENS